MTQPVKLLIVDDSSLFRKVIRRIAESSGLIEVIGEAANGREALDLIPRLNPDVVILDINMPVMDGLTALKHIMIRSPRPTVMFSTLTQDGARVTFDALKCGAVDFIHKPTRMNGINLDKQSRIIARKITLAAAVETEQFRYLRPTPKREIRGGGAEVACNYLFAVGASEGGYGALLKMIPGLLPDLPAAFLAVLYESEQSIDAFTGYLNRISSVEVKRARNGQRIRAGSCYLASGKEYVTLEAASDGYFLRVTPSPFPNRRGAINMLMFSLAEVKKNNSVGIILSGSGDDGIEGLNEIARVGGATIVQEPGTCLNQELVRAAIDSCPVHIISSDMELSEKINYSFAD